MAGRVPASTGEELNRYLTDYIRLDSEASPTVEIVLSALVLYFRYPLLAVFGLRGLVTLPCYFLLAVPAWGTSAALANLSFGRGQRSVPVAYGRDWWKRSALCAVVLLAGVCVESFLPPVFLRLVLARMLP